MTNEVARRATSSKLYGSTAENSAKLVEVIGFGSAKNNPREGSEYW